MKKTNDRKSNKNKLILLTISLLIAITFFTGGQVLAQYKTGSPAPEFVLEALDGEVYQLSQFNNKQNHLLLCFVKSNDSNSLSKLQDIISFFEDYQPKESYQIIAVVKTNQDKEEVKDNFLALQDKTDIPLLILLDNEGKAEESFQIEKYPTILLLRYDFHIRRAYDRFTSRQETSFYQYLSFLFTSQKSTGSSSSGCYNGVCPPPPGY
jgi:peroxiredoxin